MKLTGYRANSKIRDFAKKLTAMTQQRFYIQKEYNRDHNILRSDGYRVSLYVLFKTEFYKTFSDYKPFKEFFNKNKECENESGESINEEALGRAINNKCKYVIFIHPEKVYFIPTKTIKAFCEENNLIRQQDRIQQIIKIDGTDAYTREKTYCFPVSMLYELDLDSMDLMRCE